MKAKFVEPVTNNYASTYIVENYENLLKFIRSLGIVEKASDLLNDCYINMVKKEQDGTTFEYDAFTGNHTAKYVYGTLKKYAKNDRYKDGVIEVVRAEGKVIGATYCASYDEDLDGSDIKNNIKLDSFQEAYRVAADYADYAGVEDLESIREQIQYVISFSDETECNIRAFIERFDEIAGLVIDKDVLVGIKKILEYHDEFREAFRDIFEFRKDHRDIFDMILATV